MADSGLKKKIETALSLQVEEGDRVYVGDGVGDSIHILVSALRADQDDYTGHVELKDYLYAALDDWEISRISLFLVLSPDDPECEEELYRMERSCSIDRLVVFK